MSEAIQRLYISGPVSRGVAQSQMLNWANILQDYQISTHFLIFYHKGNLRKLELMFNDYQPSNVSTVKYVNILVIREVLFFAIILKYLLNFRRTKSKVILQTRSTSFGIPILITRLFGKFKVIYEIRGAGEEGLNPKITRDLLNRVNEYILLKISDKVISVSKQLLKHKSERYHLHRLKSIVIYGAADSRFFYYDQGVREQKRSELNLHDKLVLLYIGMLDKEWQAPNMIFNFVSQLKPGIPNLYLMLITPNIDIARNYCMEYKISDHECLIGEKEQKSLREYINAADFGLLLRENKLVNNVASPTKFAEYLVCGLPVIISKGIGDYSEMVEAQELGVVVSNENIDYDLLASVISSKGVFKRNLIAELGNKSLTKQKYVDLLVDSLNSL